VGIRIAAKVYAKGALRKLRKIQKADIPAAKRSAFVRAGATVVTRAATKVAKGAGVPKWMVQGGTVEYGSDKKRNRHSRFGRSGYSKKRDGIAIYFRYGHLNPGGTQLKETKLSTTKRGVRFRKHRYSDAFVGRRRYGQTAYIRDGKSLTVAKIEIARWAPGVVKNTVRTVGPKEFKKRFEHEFKRRIKRRGAR